MFTQTTKTTVAVSLLASQLKLTIVAHSSTKRSYKVEMMFFAYTENDTLSNHSIFTACLWKKTACVYFQCYRVQRQKWTVLELPGIDVMIT